MDTNGHESGRVCIPNRGECFDAEIMTREELARTVARIRVPRVGDALAKDGTIWAVVGLPRDGVEVVWGTSYRTVDRDVVNQKEYGDSATVTFMHGAGFFPAWGARP